MWQFVSWISVFTLDSTHKKAAM